MRVVRETSIESYRDIQHKLSLRQNICVNGLINFGTEGATANELVQHLVENGFLKHFDRNYVHPRLNELVKKEIIFITGKKIDSITNKKCIVYKINNKEFFE